MAEILSQSEMQSLLAYDRRAAMRGAPLGRELLQSIGVLHAGFAGELAASLRSVLRLPVELQLAAVDQMSYGELAGAMENPTCLNVLQVDPLAGEWLVEWSRPIAFCIVDRLLGGEGASASPPARAFTDIEKRLLSRTSERAIAALKNAWRDVCDLKMKVARFGSQAQTLPFVEPETVVVLVSFDVSVGGLEGTLNLCLPVRTLESVKERLRAVETSGSTQAVPRETRGGPSKDPGTGVELVAHLAATRLTKDEVANLAVGDVIMTQCDEGQPLRVSIDGEPCWAGFAGLIRGRKAVRIDSSGNSGQLPPPQAARPAGDGGPAPHQICESAERD